MARSSNPYSLPASVPSGLGKPKSLESRRVCQPRAVRSRPTTWQFFEIAGYDKDGDYLRWRDYYFKGKKTRATFNITVIEFGEHPPGDPELAFILSTIREPKKKKKKKR